MNIKSPSSIIRECRILSTATTCLLCAGIFSLSINTASRAQNAEAEKLDGKFLTSETHFLSLAPQLLDRSLTVNEVIQNAALRMREGKLKEANDLLEKVLPKLNNFEEQIAFYTMIAMNQNALKQYDLAHDTIIQALRIAGEHKKDDRELLRYLAAIRLANAEAAESKIKIQMARDFHTEIGLGDEIPVFSELGDAAVKIVAIVSATTVAITLILSKSPNPGEVAEAVEKCLKAMGETIVVIAESLIPINIYELP